MPTDWSKERRRASSGPRDLRPFGSVEWCWQTANLLQTYSRDLEASWRDVGRLLEELERAEAWSKIPPDQPYGSFEALVQAETGHRLPRICVDICDYLAERVVQGELREAFLAAYQRYERAKKL